MLVDINLLPEKERERSTLLIAALVIIGVAILFWATLFILSHRLSKETVQVEAQISGIQASQATIREGLQPTTDAGDREQLTATVDWAEAYRFETLPLLRELIALLPERGFFVSFEFTAPHESNVTVQFDDKSDAAYYLTRVKTSEEIANATLESLTAVELDEENDAQLLPRFEAVYHMEFHDERGVVVEVDEPADVDLEEQEDDLDA
ncbi:hypothetical protein SLU01_06440 [Sporosarcina luteola]|uniref:Fimbrial assembly protein n=1 Tax=Sporosarcina luteola TaxID=582850 RepID=A0A511Z4I1_9BACL|nr:fimbrial assembly protein [Sporosarcina luteola]GEN82332.1 hypothetical protein SLU01_06440 [Sporosarcina luteola]